MPNFYDRETLIKAGWFQQQQNCRKGDAVSREPIRVRAKINRSFHVIHCPTWLWNSSVTSGLEQKMPSEMKSD